MRIAAVIRSCPTKYMFKRVAAIIRKASEIFKRVAAVIRN